MGVETEGNVRAVSELIGAILLVGLVITAMAIVAVLVLSNPPPEEVPHLNALAGNTSDTILLYHTGGDELKEEQTLIRINNNPDPIPHSEIYMKSEDGTVESSSWATTKTQWGVGKTLVIPSPVSPQSITVTYQGPTSQHLVLSTSFIAGGGITTPMTTGTTVTTTTTITTTATTTVPTTNATTPTPTSPTPTPTPGCGTISGYKWNDLNGNGAWDTGEPGLSGWTLNVSQCNQGNCNSLTFLFSSVTNASGYYIFSGLNFQPATWYRVQETIQQGWQTISPSSGYQDVKLEPPGSPGQPYKCFEINVNFGNRQVQPPVVNFIGSPTSGTAPLTVQFTDQTTGSPTSWAWDVNNDGVTDYISQNPSHVYTSPGTYTVKLTASNAGGSSTKIRTDYITVTEESGINDFIAENVFIYGNTLDFRGNTVNGPGATAIINSGLDTSSTNLGASIAVTRIYIDGNLNLNSGSAGLGSSSNPGNICINGDLALGSGKRHIYGDVYVAGDFYLKDAIIHDNVYVNGDLTLDWTPTLDADARIYYTGSLNYPSGNYPQDILNKCIPQTPVPGCEMPDLALPSVKSQSWYDAKGYVSSGALTSNLKIFADSYSSTSSRPSAYNVVIIARNGDITLTGLGSSGVTGVLYAPKGRVTFNGGFFTGVVLTRDGFFVTSGGTDVTFSNFQNYFSSPDDYPL